MNAGNGRSLHKVINNQTEYTGIRYVLTSSVAGRSRFPVLPRAPTANAYPFAHGVESAMRFLHCSRSDSLINVVPLVPLVKMIAAVIVDGWVRVTRDGVMAKIR